MVLTSLPSGFPSTEYGRSASVRRRIVSLALAAVANVLLLVMLLTLAPDPTPRRETRVPASFTLLPERSEVTEGGRPAPAQRDTQTAEPQRQPRETQRPAPKTAEALPAAPPLDMIVLDRATYAATDIARLPSSSSSPADAEPARSAGDSALVAGRGPGGEPLYKAEWYREPSDADLAGDGYSRGPGNGWGEIACRTAPGYRVEDCVEFAQSPPTSGLARVVRDAAPRFRVRPPRIGGRSLVGGWVLIRITYSERRPG